MKRHAARLRLSLLAVLLSALLPAAAGTAAPAAAPATISAPAAISVPATAPEAAQPTDSTDFICPPRLHEGDTVALIAPAGKLSERVDTARIRQRFAEWGLHVRFGTCLNPDKRAYFAAPDSVRARELQQAIDDPAVKAVIACRGGYGSVRLLGRLRLEALREHPKWIVGFSDITTLHLALRRLGIESIHGPMPGGFRFEEEGKTGGPRKAGPAGTTPAGRSRTTGTPNAGPDSGGRCSERLAAGRNPEGPEREGDSSESLRQALFGELRCIEAEPHPLNRPGEACGRLAGGNLTVICAANGTPEALQTQTPTILFLEEIGESAYRIDRMMQSLERCGVLRNLRGVVVGHFTRTTGCDRFGVEEPEALLDAYLRPLGIPVAYGFPAGHEEPNQALYLGREVRLKVGEEGVRLDFENDR